MESLSLNQLGLQACLVELSGPRYTPAGIPAVDAVLEHASEQIESGQTRQVALKVKTVAFGAVAEALSRQALGSRWQFTGFLANTRNGKGVVFHVQDFKPI